MTAEQINSFARELRKRLDRIEDLMDIQNTEMDSFDANSFALIEEKKQIVKNCVKGYLKNEKKQLTDILEKLENVVLFFDKEYKIKRTHKAVVVSDLPLEESRLNLHKKFIEIEKICNSLNNINFSDIDPETTFFVDSKTLKVMSKKGATVSEANNEKIDVLKEFNSKLSKLYFLLDEVKELIDYIEKKYEKQLNVEKFFNSVTLIRDQHRASLKNRNLESLNKEINTWLLTEDSVINENVFAKIKETGNNSLPNYSNGSFEFNRYYNIGNVLQNISGDKINRDIPLIEKSPILSKYIKGGKLAAPYVLDLKKCGNIFIDTDSQEMTLSQNTINFIHEYIQGFLLRQPSTRVNLCLFDFNDQCKFNRYAPLKTLSQSSLFKGITRSERDAINIICDIEEMMFDIGDNKLSTNSVSDIFEYNEKSHENPQNIHVVILLDFPGKYSLEAISHIEKIVSNGGNAGIYTMIVSNNYENSDFGSRQSIFDNAVKSIKNHAICMKESFGEYKLNDGSSFVPHNKLTPDHFSSNVYNILKRNMQKQKNAVIPMHAMFDVDREYKLVNGVKNDFSKLIEIPIGKNGGEVQSIKFSTTGDNSAHALVIGGTGSGKSNLLHTVILSSCFRYSPEELNIYLIDFKGGVEFKYYEANKNKNRQLPHILLTGLTSEPEDGVAILTNIRSILKERESLFRRNNVEDIVQYNEKNGKNNAIPRLLVIIDEVQELFAHEKLSQKALTILGELFKKGRAFGISILWASQTVPKATGGDFKDKVLSQIGNRICLKLNNPDDAESIGIKEDKVRMLNRPEKGLGIIYDGMDFIEFRVAYAENSENRNSYIYDINGKWADIIRGMDNRELFIVGDDEIPNASVGAMKYRENYKIDTLAKSNNDYILSIGQDYVSGAPFEIPMGLRATKENVLLAGKNAEELSDIMGYMLLSTIIENRTNSDFNNMFSKSIYYYNGEIGDNNTTLYNNLPKVYSDDVSFINGNEEFINDMVQLYILRKSRFSHIGNTYTPIFVFIHKMQVIAELFSDNKLYSVENDTIKNNDVKSENKVFGQMEDFSALGLGTPRISSGGKLTFREIFKELLQRGPDVGIHFVISMNDPSSIIDIRGELKNFSHKIFLAGVPNESVVHVVDTYLFGEKVPKKDGVAFYYNVDSMSKFKMYRYSHATDNKWLSNIISKYKNQ